MRKCTILGLSGAITTQSSINAGGNIASDGNISSLGSISAGTTLSAGGTISTSGNITASAGTITGKTLAITGTSGRPQIPTAQGCYIGQASSGYTAIELVSGVGTTYQTYIFFPSLMHILEDGISTRMQPMISNFVSTLFPPQR